jgi:thiamine biosynthesis lipoprotein ApbE
VRGITHRLLSLALWGAACRPGARRPAVFRAAEAMGAVLSVAAWGPDSAALRRATDRAVAAARGPAVASGAVDSLRARVTRETGLPPDSELVARGAALDRALVALRDSADSAVLDLAGLYLLRIGSARPVGVADPENSLRSLATISVPAGTWGVSTVSLVEQSDPPLDPRTGKPADRARAVTALAPTAAIAAAWSAVFYVLGCDSALALARRAGVRVLCADDRIRWTADLDGRVSLPTDSAPVAGSAPAPGPARAPAAAAGANGSMAPTARSDSPR